MDIGVEERRVAIEVIATLVKIKHVMADLILKPAGIPPEIYRSLLYRRDPSTGRILSKRQIAPLIVEAVEDQPDSASAIRAIVEIAANWRVSPRWTLSPGYSFEQIHMHTELKSRDAEAASNAEGSSPRHSAQLRSHFAWSAILAWDASAYFVNRLRDQNLPSYTRLDTQLTWRGTERLSISAVGQNLLKDRHLEFIDSNGSVNSSLIKRSGYVELRWQF